MSLRSTVRALPTLFRVGFAEMVAYRAEMLVWCSVADCATSARFLR